jgi:hypothetical protein
MKIIIISNRKYRSILAKLQELEDCLKVMRPEIEGTPLEQTVSETDNFGEVYIDGEKVCELLCISGRTLLRMCKKHQIKSTRVSHRCYYPMNEIEKLFAQRSIAFSKEMRERLKSECRRLKEQNDNEKFDSHE